MAAPGDQAQLLLAFEELARRRLDPTLTVTVPPGSTGEVHLGAVPDGRGRLRDLVV